MATTAPSALAIHGGTPVRDTYLPYGRQSIDEGDIAAVTAVLKSDYLTTGPEVERFETAFAKRVGARHAVAFSSGTAALHGAMVAAGIGEGDEIVTTPLTFCATSNAALYVGARPVFADIRPDTLTLDPAAVAARLTPRTRAIVSMDYAGQPANHDAFRALADAHGLRLIEDACHALGATWHGRPVGSLADLTCFSLHPVKHITTGEGGMVTTDHDAMAAVLRRFRSHGIRRGAELTDSPGDWYYEMVDLGYNYRLTDIGCALGRSQLARLDAFLAPRRAIADYYRRELADLSELRLPTVEPHTDPVWHLYPIRLELERLTVDRDEVFRALRAENIGVQVHYIPVHLQPYYRQHQGGEPGQYPIAEDAFRRLLSLPVFSAMSLADAADVVAALRKIIAVYRRA